MGATEGPGYAFWFMVVRSLFLLGACGPNLACIASDKWGLLSHCLFDETQVEFQLSSCSARYVGRGPSLGHTPCTLGEGSTFLGYVASWLCQEFVP